jgi:hypothetical protein
VLLAPLPLSALEAPPDRRHQTFVIIRHHQPDPGKPTPHQVPEHFGPTRLALGIRHRHTDDVTLPALRHTDNQQHALTGYPAVLPYPLIPRIHNQIRVFFHQPPVPPLLQVFIQPLDRPRHSGSRDLRAAQLLGYRPHPPGRYALQIHLLQRQKKRLLATLVVVEHPGPEPSRPFGRHRQLESAHPGLECSRPVAAAVPAAHSGPLIRPGLQKLSHLRLQQLLDELPYHPG